MLAFLRVLLIIMVVYYALIFIGRTVFPYLLKRYIRKMGNNFNANQSTESKKQEGDVSIIKKPTKNESSKDGEYVDFEEITD